MREIPNNPGSTYSRIFLLYAFGTSRFRSSFVDLWQSVLSSGADWLAGNLFKCAQWIHITTLTPRFNATILNLKSCRYKSPGAPFELFMSLKSRDFTPRRLTYKLISVNISPALQFFAMSIYSYALKIYFLIKAYINVIEQMLVNSFMLFR